MSRRDRRRGTWWPAAVLAALALVWGAACSGSDSESTQAPAAGEGAGGEAATDRSGVAGRVLEDEGPEVERADPGDVDPEGDDDDDGEPEWFTPYEERVYPLSAFIGELEAELFPEQEAVSSDRVVVKEQMIFDCMTEQGFRYEVVDYAAIEAAMPSLDEEDVMSTLGYGMAFSLGPPMVIESSYVDPNDAIKAGLSADELEAWDQQRSQCRREASAWLDEPGIVRRAFDKDSKALMERIDADPRVVAAHAGWSECMAQHGHRYDSKHEIFEYLGPIADRLQARLQELGGHDRIDAALHADLDALQAIEVEIAVADLACSKRLDQVVYEVTVEHEQRFLDENQDRLALLREELPTMTFPPVEWVCAAKQPAQGLRCLPAEFAGKPPIVAP